MLSLAPQRDAAPVLLGLTLALIFILIMSVPAAADDAVLAAATPDPAASQDYYTRRAQEILKQDEKANAVAPHPLAAAYPNHSVVVCEAGCPGEHGAEVVFMERRQEAAQASPGKSAAVKQAATIDCVGGCYDTPRRYEAAKMEGVPSERPADAKIINPDRAPFDPRY